jgi:RAMP superfamily
MQGHNPVPFDFVPFAIKAPELRKVEDWENEGQLLSGRIDYSVTTLTPVHIVGKQESKGRQNNTEIEKSYFSCSGGVPTVPGSSIKGMLRAFFEALTNSWVSQATNDYPAKRNDRHIGFSAYGPVEKDDVTGTPAIPKRFHPEIKDGKIDLASFLFGMVIEGDDDDKAQKSRLIFEDIPVSKEQIDDSSMKLPDIPGKAFMGGPKPRKNNWWYFRPHSIRKRIAITPIGNKSVTDFIGDEFWGRKFYYHQDPEKVLQWYNNIENWPHTTKKRGQVVNNYYNYPVETIPSGNRLSGHIYFERVPEQLLNLFIFALQPDNYIKHKIGYGKAFGLGSIDITVENIKTESAIGFTSELTQFKIDVENLRQQNHIQENSLTWLSLILKYDNLIESSEGLFTYPAFEKDFRKVIDWDRYIGSQEDFHRVNSSVAQEIAQSLFKVKRTIHFRFYQETSNIWDKILKRK